MLRAALLSFCLARVTFTDFAYSRWKTTLGIVLLAACSAWDPVMASQLELVGLSPWWGATAVGLGVLVSTLLAIPVTRWWFRRGGRWDGQGSLYNLLIGSWWVSGMLSAVLVALGVTSWLTIPFTLYALWTSVHALKRVTTGASWGYTIAGYSLLILPAIAGFAVVIGLTLTFGAIFLQPPVAPLALMAAAVS